MSMGCEDAAPRSRAKAEHGAALQSETLSIKLTRDLGFPVNVTESPAGFEVLIIGDRSFGWRRGWRVDSLETINQVAREVFSDWCRWQLRRGASPRAISLFGAASINEALSRGAALNG